MTNFIQKSIGWSYKISENKREPFEEKLLKINHKTPLKLTYKYSLKKRVSHQSEDCSPEEIQKKLKFLTDNILYIKSECEALEMYLIRVHPEFLETGLIDVSWMPYDLKIEKPKLVMMVPKVMKTLRKHSTVAKSILSDNFFSVVQRTIVVKKISLDDMINIIGRQIMNLENDFNKHFIKMRSQCRRIDNEIEGYEAEIQRALHHVENYKSQILEAAFNKITKRIPASKYRLFIKKRSMKNTIAITEFTVKILNLIKKNTRSKMQILDLKNSQSKITETDVWQLTLINKKLMRQSKEQLKIKKSLLANKRNIYQDNLVKNNKMEKYKKGIDLQSLDRQIQNLKNNLKKQHFTRELTEKDDDKLFQDDTENMISDDLITHYVEIINYIEKSDLEIESLEKRIHRQSLTIQLYCKKLKKYIKIKKLNFNCCSLKYNNVKDNISQYQTTDSNLNETEFDELTEI